MICEKCAAEGRKSRIYPVPFYGATTGWVDPVEQYYDEDGNAHIHDTQWQGNSFKCTNGHEFYVAKLRKCPCDNCDWNKKELTKVTWNDQ